jgi:hypothetical protein
VTHNVAEATVVLRRPTAWKSSIELENLSVQYVRFVIQRVLLKHGEVCHCTSWHGKRLTSCAESMAALTSKLSDDRSLNPECVDSQPSCHIQPPFHLRFASQVKPQPGISYVLLPTRSLYT